MCNPKYWFASIAVAFRKLLRNEDELKSSSTRFRVYFVNWNQLWTDGKSLTQEISILINYC
jgi:hypothetical protein